MSKFDHASVISYTFIHSINFYHAYSLVALIGWWGHKIKCPSKFVVVHCSWSNITHAYLAQAMQAL